MKDMDYKKELRQRAAGKLKPTDREQEAALRAFKAANQPIKLRNKDLKLGAREIDIRHLDQENLNQVQFRLECQQVSILNDLNNNVIDLERLLMLVLKKLGVIDLTEELDELMSEIHEKIKKN